VQVKGLLDPDAPAPAVPVTSVTVNPSSFGLVVGMPPAPLTVTVLPENATDKSVSWSATPEGIVVVDAKGVVTALKAGQATVTATAHNGVSGSCQITVTAPNTPGQKTAVEALLGVVVSPNPFDAQFTVHHAAQVVRYELVNASGLVVLSGRGTGETLHIDNPSKLPATNHIAEIREPIILANILVPKDYLGAVIGLCIEKRGVQKDMQFAGHQVQLRFEMPMSEVVLDFFDRLKSVSRGFASFDYEFRRFDPANLVRLDVLINGDKVDSLSIIIHREHAQSRGRDLVERMRDLIPRQMFEVAIQAAIGNQVIARSTVKALRKNVLAKCYGGDVSRKRKLLEKQKAGKKRMKQVGSVEIPQEAFLAVLKVDNNSN